MTTVKMSVKGKRVPLLKRMIKGGESVNFVANYYLMQCFLQHEIFIQDFNFGKICHTYLRLYLIAFIHKIILNGNTSQQFTFNSPVYRIEHI